jgi:hypothetical protein
MNIHSNKLITQVFLICILALFACKGSKKITSSARLPDLSKVTADVLQGQLDNLLLQENWVKAAAKMNARFNGDSYSVTANILLKKDEIVSVSVRKLGFEVARLLVLPDTAWIINRLDRTYMQYSMDELGAFIGFPVNMSLLQSMVLGHPPMFDKTRWEIEDNKTLVLLSDQFNLKAKSKIDYPKMFASESEIIDQKNNRKLESKFSNYQQVKDNKYFPYIRSYELNAEIDDPLSVQLQFTSIEVDTPFTVDTQVPQRYTRVYN